MILSVAAFSSVLAWHLMQTFSCFRRTKRNKTWINFRNNVFNVVLKKLEKQLCSCASVIDYHSKLLNNLFRVDKYVALKLVNVKVQLVVLFEFHLLICLFI